MVVVGGGGGIAVVDHATFMKAVRVFGEKHGGLSTVTEQSMGRSVATSRTQAAPVASGSLNLIGFTVALRYRYYSPP